MYKGYFLSLKYIPAKAIMMHKGQTHPRGGPLVSYPTKVIMMLNINSAQVEFNIYRDLIMLTDKDYIFGKFVSELAQKLEGQVFNVSEKMKIINFNEVVGKCL